MTRNRTLPFGYQMRNGRAGFHAQEAQTVQNIYTWYLEGYSYQRIADILSQGDVPYHPNTSQWNKHSVKRILENHRYLGGEELPALVDEALFRQASDLRQSKMAGYIPPPAWAKMLKGKIQCSVCGKVHQRDTRRRYARWYCAGDTTHPAHEIRETDLEACITEKLNYLVEHPQLVEMPQANFKTNNSEVLRMDNEIRRMTSRPGCDLHKAVALIFSVAAERYAQCDDGSAIHLVRTIRTRLQNAAPDQTLDAGLFRHVVQTIHLHPSGSFRLTLLTGQTIE